MRPVIPVLALNGEHAETVRLERAVDGEFRVTVPLTVPAIDAVVPARTLPLTLAVDATVTQAPELVAPFGVPADAARITALLYLVDLATRYLTDRQAEAGARLGVLGSWLLPVLIRRVGDL